MGLLLAAIVVLCLACAAPAKEPEGSKETKVADSFGFEPSPISVIIPVIPRDFEVLTKLVGQLQAQTLPPKELVIAASSTDDAEGEHLERKLEEAAGAKFTIRVTSTKDKQKPGENRNRGVPLVTSKYIAFTDADDEMHPDWLKVTADAFDKYNAKCVLHSYVFDKNHEMYKPELRLDDAAVQMGESLYWSTVNYDKTRGVATAGDDIISDDIDAGLAWAKTHDIQGHHGHAAVTKEVAKGLQFDGGEMGEDVRFLRRLMKKYGPHDDTVIWVDLPLSVYHPSNDPRNEHYKDKDKGGAVKFSMANNAVNMMQSQGNEYKEVSDMEEFIMTKKQHAIDEVDLAAMQSKVDLIDAKIDHDAKNALKAINKAHADAVQSIQAEDISSGVYMDEVVEW